MQGENRSLLEMPIYGHTQAPDSFLKAVQHLENTADLCYKHLQILKYPPVVACWGLLARIVLKIEEAAQQFGYGSQTHGTVLYNLSRAGAQGLSWIHEHGVPDLGSRYIFTLDAQLFAAADQVLWTAAKYDFFTATFPLWHKSLLSAELVTPEMVRFHAGEDSYSRRVRAYQQGLRPPADRGPSRPGIKLDAEFERHVQTKIRKIVENAAGSEFSFDYGYPTKLYSDLRDEYLQATKSLFRRNGSLKIGTYTLEEFRHLYSSILAICAVHEHACFVRGQLTGSYPKNSGPMIFRKRRWIKLLKKVSSLSEALVIDMVSDLMFGETKALDLHVHPFVSSSESPDILVFAPHFPLKSRADENIFRVCSSRRPALHDVLTSTKEEEMREELKYRAPATFHVTGPRSLPEGLPDIDLIVEDPKAGVVVIAELKWLRKTLRSIEHVEQQRRFLHGVGQTKRIREFLSTHPSFLLDRGDVARSLRDYKKVYFLVLPRDYFIWFDPGDVPVIDYDVFTRMLGESADLELGMQEMLNFDWLPSPGRDFTIRYDASSVNGVSVETEVIYPTY